MLKVGIIGSRRFPAPELVTAFVKAIADYDIMVISGACPNSPDEWAVNVAKALNIPYKEYPADWSNGKGAGMARNSIIAQESDIVIAFHYNGSKGTLDTIIKTIRLGKQAVTVTVYEGLQEAYDLVHKSATND